MAAALGKLAALRAAVPEEQAQPQGKAAARALREEAAARRLAARAVREEAAAPKVATAASQARSQWLVQQAADRAGRAE
jgi:hypothetical protein